MVRLIGIKDGRVYVLDVGDMFIRDIEGIVSIYGFDDCWIEG